MRRGNRTSWDMFWQIAGFAICGAGLLIEWMGWPGGMPGPVRGGN